MTVRSNIPSVTRNKVNYQYTATLSLIGNNEEEALDHLESHTRHPIIDTLVSDNYKVFYTIQVTFRVEAENYDSAYESSISNLMNLSKYYTLLELKEEV